MGSKTFIFPIAEAVLAKGFVNTQNIKRFHQLWEFVNKTKLCTLITAEFCHSNDFGQLITYDLVNRRKSSCEIPRKVSIRDKGFAQWLENTFYFANEFFDNHVHEWLDFMRWTFVRKKNV